VHVPVTWEYDGDNVTIEPRTVSVICEINKQDADYTIESVTIWPSGPSALLSKYKVDLKGTEFVPNIHVSGPQEQIDQIKNGAFTPVALLYLRSDDIKNVNKDSTRELHFDLPPGVRVTNDRSQYTIPFTLIPNE
jgi:hypothetical protein